MENSPTEDSRRGEFRLPRRTARRAGATLDAATTTVYLLVMFAAVAVGIGSDGLLRWAAIGLVVAVGAAVATRSGPTRIGLLLAMVFAGTAPWNAVSFGSLRPSDLALVAAIGFLVLSRRGFGALPGLVLPAWLLVLAVTVAALTAAHELFPTSAEYLFSRVQVDAAGATTSGYFTNVGIGGRWLISLLGVTVLCVLVRQQGIVWLYRMAVVFVAGVAVSGLVAVTDSFGITAISARFVVPDSGGRQAGLTVHPNHLAASACLAIPFVCWAFVQASRRVKVLAALSTPFVLLAVYESGSRGGAVCVVLAAALTLVLVKRLRSRLPVIVGLVFGAMFVVFGLYPDALAHLLTSVRLSNGAGVDVSDEVRNTLGAQGAADFRHSPFVGIGMQVGLDAHNIYRQTLAAGGIVLFGAFVVFGIGALRCAVRVGRTETLAFAGAASLAAWLLFGMVENLLVDRFLYLPVGIIVALLQRPWNTADADASVGHTAADVAHDAAGTVPAAPATPATPAAPQPVGAP